MSQEAMAQAGRVGRRSQVNYEQDERSPDASYLSGIAAAGADVGYIVTGQRPERPVGAGGNDAEAALLDAYHALHANERAALHTLLDAITRCRSAAPP